RRERRDVADARSATGHQRAARSRSRRGSRSKSWLPALRRSAARLALLRVIALLLVVVLRLRRRRLDEREELVSGFAEDGRKRQDPRAIDDRRRREGRWIERLPTFGETERIPRGSALRLESREARSRDRRARLAERRVRNADVRSRLEEARDRGPRRHEEDQRDGEKNDSFAIQPHGLSPPPHARARGRIGGADAPRPIARRGRVDLKPEKLDLGLEDLLIVRSRRELPDDPHLKKALLRLREIEEPQEILEAPSQHDRRAEIVRLPDFE